MCYIFNYKCFLNQWKVVGISNLRTKLSGKDERVQLYNDYDGVFADEKIIHLLPKVLGPVFYNKKK